MTKKKDSQEDKQVFMVLGLVFGILGLSFMFGDATRTTGIPFLVMGVVFIAVSVVSSNKSRKK